MQDESSDQSKNNKRSLKQNIGLLAGPAAALIILLFLDMNPANPAVARAAAVAILMAIWWITEAIPIPATALIPVALFPLMGIMSGKVVAGTYFNHVIFLFIGGFIMALAMQRWNLHRRIALRIVMLIGTSPRRIIFGFMAATAFLSMWISNTATTMMMVPIALALILKMREITEPYIIKKFSIALLIGIAYSASIGGFATLIGTPPNLSFSRIFAIYFPQAPEISFAQWFVFGLPVSIIFLLIAWLLLTTLFMGKAKSFGSDMGLFKSEYKSLGRIGYEEKIVLILFVVMALAWLLRKDITAGQFIIPGWSSIFPVPKFIDDGTIAIFFAFLLFIIPSRSNDGKRGPLMNWNTAKGLNWGIVLLFGGGFALATGFKESGLSVWIAERLIALEGVSPVVMVGMISGLMTFMTELTSNTATTEMTLPLLGSLAVAIKANPLLLMIPATLSASCAFMLPVATPPNAIVFGSGELNMSDMLKAGIIMNLIGIVLITAAIYLIGVHVFDIHIGQMPAWAH